ncbi:endopeptidase La [Candidatus Liberibacter asiaticus]|uniref:endopeptidase La n=1 Tax=Liberibacter asiaticus TaxID=34021 RepID=UPI0014948BE3|nr:endopeptidase La [Candidatus Liberibacter asiaticus]MBE2996180.1 endopeptidase La [Candidatus Liberibacter asiaticus]MCU7488181.1 endopeptidase La [Candidatus Liberibacter asiaticus]MCU7489211.1 endopeptidase La [Candidatus Liberibacter asiaticus]MDI1494001.1 endopeptidase La [Candidatus Liberibacter asiaticus]QMV55185.1 endopeptidase La [Candidatus Liberibacter asiaticus]
MIYPLLPLRDIVVFPYMIVPLFVGREKSVRALDEAMNSHKKIILVTQMNSNDENPIASSVYRIGTIVDIVQILRLPDGTVKILVEGSVRARIVEYIEREDFLEAITQVLPDPTEDPVELEALSRSVIAEFSNYIKLNKKISPEVIGITSQIEGFSKLADVIAANLSIKVAERQKILEAVSVKERLEMLLVFMESEISVLQVEKRIRSRVKRQMEKTQREYYLHEQMKAIQKELDNGEEGRDEISDFEARISKIRLSKEAREKALSELQKLRQMNPLSAESSVVRNYLDWLLGVPWDKKSKTKKNLDFAIRILDQDHFGLEKVKERIIEYLAVQMRVIKNKGLILCFVGPPGVGKTSLAQSIAKATGRQYVRMSLGGVYDEADIRGHRRTYIGSMPGRIIQSLKRAKRSNPLLLLDEIDKMGSDLRGDPSAALLEVLDPAQNSSFVDHYLEVEYDLSDVMFIMTANTLNIPLPLMDRMEIIRIAGYTEEEKLQIAKNHLVKKVLTEHALKQEECCISDGVLLDIIRLFTHEAGVRSFERALMKIARKAVTKIVKNSDTTVSINENNLQDYLGVPRYKYGKIEGEDQVGIVTGLAWTEVGGEILTVEGVIMPGKGEITITGNLKEIMKESILAASSYVRSKATTFGIIPSAFNEINIHVHVPEGATPKDGPSAGIAMATAIVSIMTCIPVYKNVAMTGELTLRGRVLPIGGLKEKLLAALRAGVTKVLIPEENIKDLMDIPENVKNGLEIIPVSFMGEVLKHALLRMPDPLESEGNKSIPLSVEGIVVGKDGRSVAH